MGYSSETTCYLGKKFDFKSWYKREYKREYVEPKDSYNITDEEYEHIEEIRQKLYKIISLENTNHNTKLLIIELKTMETIPDTLHIVSPTKYNNREVWGRSEYINEFISCKLPSLTSDEIRCFSHIFKD